MNTEKQIDIFNLCVADQFERRVVAQFHSALMRDDPLSIYCRRRNTEAVYQQDFRRFQDKLRELSIFIEQCSDVDVSADFEQSVQECVDYLGEQYLDRSEKKEIKLFKEKMYRISQEKNKQLFVVNWNIEYDCQCFVVIGDVNDFRCAVEQIKKHIETYLKK